MNSSRDLLRLQLMALDVAANAVVITDGNGNTLWTNPAFTTLTGFPADEAIGQTLAILKSGTQDPGVYRELWRAIRAGRVWRGRLVNRRKDGTLYSEEQTITPVMDDAGQISHFIAVKHDISADQEVRHRLQAHDDLFRLLLENALDIIAILTLDGVIRYASPSVHRILGYEPHELEGRSAFELMSEEDVVRARATMEQLRDRPGAMASLDFRFRHRDGTWRTLEASGKNMLHEPVVAGVLVNARDVTRRTQIEAELTRQREAHVQSEKLADMGTLLAGVAHELNNPLTVVAGYSAILRRDLRGSPGGERVDKIAAAAERCVRIVRNFLALARQYPPERQPVCPNQIVRDAVELLAYPLRMDNVEVHLELDQNLPSLWADPHQLHQAIVNLITNAHNAMHVATTPRRLSIRTRSDAAGSGVSFEVQDTGDGIPPEILPRIFEPFFTTKPVGQGTGLGLPLCRGIVEAHGGTIRVESTPGAGTVVLIELPVVPAPAKDSKEPPAHASLLAPGRRILVIDDEPDVAGVLVDLLTSEGVLVESVSDGTAALEKLEQSAYDLILCDVRMPKLDGPALYRALATSHPELLERFVFLTGDTLNPESREFVQGTGAPCITKPFSFEEIRRVIERALRIATPSSRPAS